MECYPQNFETQAWQAIAAPEAWQEDQRTRMHPELVTRLLHNAAPLLQFADWRVTKTGLGYAETELPLTVNTTNQHGTHQAGLLLAAADYTGGVAMGSLFHGVPVIGVHPQTGEFGAALWSFQVNMRWLRPSCHTLICKASIAEEKCQQIVARFFAGKRIIETITIQMENDGVPVAQAEFTYWARDARLLKEEAYHEEKIHVLYDHKIKSSALLIAALRAMEQEKPAPERLFHDALSPQIIDDQARVLAKRFCQRLPQLQSLVALRTQHLDTCLQSFHASGGRQALLLGAGLDLRPLRLQLRGVKWYELDLPAMLALREKHLHRLGLASLPDRRLVEIDLLNHDLAQRMAETPGFDATQPTFVIWEGGSMYFNRADFNKILTGLRPLLRHEKSEVWMDYVDEKVIAGITGCAAVEAFMEGMQCLGEPFIHGLDPAAHGATKLGLELISDEPAAQFVSTDDPIYELYRFARLRR